MSAERVARPAPWLGCVVATRPGLARVWTDLGEVTAGYGSGLLGRIARDRGCVPGPGDWVLLHRWHDGRVTIEDVRHVDPAGTADVVELRRR